MLVLLWILILYIGPYSCYNQCFDLKNSVSSLCKKIQCENYAECHLDKFSRNATCKCIDKCYSFGDSIDSQEVCGNDGKDYKNFCELKKFSCQEKKDIEIKYFGKCDTCKDIKCLPNQTCIVDDNRQPTCRCDDSCKNTSFEPVCGSDGQTYYNECTLRVEACKQRKSLHIIFKGNCEENEDKNLCKKLNCGKYEFCDINLQKNASCICPTQCPLIMAPVCANDGNTYDSICDLRKHACLSKKDLSILHHGSCNETTLCENLTCSFGSVCKINSDTFEQTCECEECSMEYQPVCGSDGFTYINECFLKKENCINKKEIEITRNGICTSCMIHKCENYSTCKMNLNKTVECVCNFNCSNVEQLVCGSNKQVFKNECELQKKSCETNTEITSLTDFSDCDSCSNVFCKYGAHCYNGKCVCPVDCPKDLYEPVCSNTGVTFNNECELRKTACINNRNIKNGIVNYDKLDGFNIAFFGECIKTNSINEEPKLVPVLGKTPVFLSSNIIGNYITMCNENTCKFGGKCFYNDKGVPTCLCNFDCSQLKIENVCGSDGRVYLNECKLQEEACIRQQKIEIINMSHCLSDKKFTICNLNVPYIDNSSAKFSDCNPKSFFYKKCPENYTCFHHKKILSSIRSFLVFKDQDHLCCLNTSLNQNFHFDDSQNNSLVIKPENNKCNCNKLGSDIPIKCNEKSGKCFCKPGVGGLKCDRCEPGFWAMHKLSQGNNGCLPCECNKNGSLREDCEQQTGRCICKIGLTGMKCDICPNGKSLTSFGCIDESLLKVQNGKCSSKKCKFGSVCKEISTNRTQCVCNLSCRKKFESTSLRNNFNKRDISNLYFGSFKKARSMEKSKVQIYLSRPVCGSDNNTHSNECEMRIHSCRMQKKIVKIKDEQCSSTLKNMKTEKENWYAVTQTIKRSTLEKENNDLMKIINENYFSFTTEPSFNEIIYQNSSVSEIDPMFLGKSFIEIARLENLDYIRIEILFIPFLDKGIIFYSGQNKNGEGDFISLTMNYGYFEYRFNLGSGVYTVRSKEKVKKFKKNKIILIKDNKKGTLIINDKEEDSIIAEGEWKTLNLNENFFLGFVNNANNKIFENLNGIKTGLVGCIQKISFGKNLKDQKEINFNIIENLENNLSNSVLFNSKSLETKFSSTKILKNFAIQDCSYLKTSENNFCEKFNSCVKGSVCVDLISSFDCICLETEKCLNQHLKENKKLHPSAKVKTLDFWGNSWISLKTLNNIARAFVIEIWFLSRKRNGVLIYNGNKNSKGDFLSLNLKNSKIEFKFDLGSKISNIKSTVEIQSHEEIKLNYWHKVKITRLDEYGYMQIDGKKYYSAKAKGNLTELNLDEPFFIGGVNKLLNVNPNSDVKKNFNGAIQRIIINGEHYIGSKLLKESIDRNDVSSYEDFPCSNYENKCGNKLECLPILNEYKCKK